MDVYWNETSCPLNQLLAMEPTPLPCGDMPRGGGGYSGINVTGGRGGGVRRIFLGLKFSTPVFFCVEDLTVYFLGLKNLRVFFWV